MPALETHSPSRVRTEMSTKIAPGSIEKETSSQTQKTRGVSPTAHAKEQPDEDSADTHLAADGSTQNDIVSCIGEASASCFDDTDNDLLSAERCLQSDQPAEETYAYQVVNSARRSDIATQTSPVNPRPTKVSQSQVGCGKDDEGVAANEGGEEPDASPLLEVGARTGNGEYYISSMHRNTFSSSDNLSCCNFLSCFGSIRHRVFNETFPVCPTKTTSITLYNTESSSVVFECHVIVHSESLSSAA